ncbi:MAG: hypothetical protein J2P49_02045 [Methylocapsa sp.]|nr:hypothetical protein [Methylocapsa sp.]
MACKSTAKTGLHALAALRARHPWPELSELEGAPPYVWNLDGRELVTELIRNTRPRIFLEVGTFLGGSALSWLAAHPDLVLIALDPWTGGIENFVDMVIDSPPSWVESIEPLRPIAAAIRQHGIANVALHNLRAFRDRVIPVRMPAEMGYPHIRSFVEPDIIYIDATKQPQEYLLVHELFPAATLCGDDWTWQDETGTCPVRNYFHKVAALRDCSVLAKDATWLLAKN